MPTVSACDLYRRCIHRRASVDWQEFLRRYGWRIRAAIRRAFQRRGHALREGDLEELVQDLFCRLLGTGGRHRFRGHDDVQLWSYLAKVAHSLEMDRRRNAHAHKRMAEVIPFNELVEELPSQVVSSELSPEVLFLEEERWRVFFCRCHHHLHGDRSIKVRAMRMALRDGWSSREISRQLGGALNPGQIDGLVHRLTRRVAAEGLPVPRRAGGWNMPGKPPADGAAGVGSGAPAAASAAAPG